MTFGFRPDTVCVHTGVQRQIQPRLVYLQREDEELVTCIDDLVERFGHRKLLLFANSHSRCDRLFALLHHQGRRARYLGLSVDSRQETFDWVTEAHDIARGLISGMRAVEGCLTPLSV